MQAALNRIKFFKVWIKRLFFIFSIAFIFSCEKNTCRQSKKPIATDIEVERLEQQLFDLTSVDEIIQFLSTYPGVAKNFLDADQYPSDTVLATRIFQIINTTSIDTLLNESLEAFLYSFDPIEDDLERGIGILRAYYPETSIPKIQTMVTGLYKDLFINKNHIIIGLDYFIGDSATYKPNQIPAYILDRYNVTHLSSIILNFISSQYVKPGNGESLLIEMIDHGKAYYLLSKILPCTFEWILIGYTEEEWKRVMKNEAVIWANFIQNEWLYTTSHFTKQKFLGERPFTYEIGRKCPGRIGAWLGWQIVNEYVEKKGIRVTELMEETDHLKIFNDSGYKPGK